MGTQQTSIAHSPSRTHMHTHAHPHPHTHIASRRHCARACRRTRSRASRRHRTCASRPRQLPASHAWPPRAATGHTPAPAPLQWLPPVAPLGCTFVGSWSRAHGRTPLALVQAPKPSRSRRAAPCVATLATPCALPLAPCTVAAGPCASIR